jgi:hypothetical protein
VSGRCLAVALALLAVCYACGRQTTDVAERWLGQWSGPEGTWLRIGREGAAYAVTIRDLDGEQTFAATAREDGLEFERAGRVETLHATDGTGTGMKWLAEKSDCLAVRSGEGYCRD